MPNRSASDFTALKKNLVESEVSFTNPGRLGSHTSQTTLINSGKSAVANVAVSIIALINKLAYGGLGVIPGFLQRKAVRAFALPTSISQYDKDIFLISSILDDRVTDRTSSIWVYNATLNIVSQLYIENPEVFAFTPTATISTAAVSSLRTLTITTSAAHGMEVGDPLLLSMTTGLFSGGADAIGLTTRNWTATTGTTGSTIVITLPTDNPNGNLTITGGTAKKLGRAPVSLCVGPGGDIFIPDQTRHVVWALRKGTSKLELVAGVLDTPGLLTGDALTTACLTRPRGIVQDTRGTLYITHGFANNRTINSVTFGTGVTNYVFPTNQTVPGVFNVNDTVTVLGFVASGMVGVNGTGVIQSITPDAGTGLTTIVINISSSGTVPTDGTTGHKIGYITKGSNIPTGGGIAKLVGTTISGVVPYLQPFPDNQPSSPFAITVDNVSNNLYYFDGAGLNKFNLTTNVRTTISYPGINPRTLTFLNKNNRLYATDAIDPGRIFTVDTTTGTLTRIAGDGTLSGVSSGSNCGGPFNNCESLKDGGDPLLAGLSYPYQVAFGSSGRMYIADGNTNRIRIVDFTKNIITSWNPTPF